MGLVFSEHVHAQEVTQAGQDQHETLETLFNNIDLSFAKRVLKGCFHNSVPGRHPRNPLDLFRTFIITKMKAIRSLREMTRILDSDLRLRKLCLIKKKETAYPRSVLSRFSGKVGDDKLTRIIEEKVIKLLKQKDAKEVDAVFDASFINAWSTRDPINKSNRIFRQGSKGRKNW